MIEHVPGILLGIGLMAMALKSHYDWRVADALQRIGREMARANDLEEKRDRERTANPVPRTTKR